VLLDKETLTSKGGGWDEVTMRMWMIDPRLLCDQHLLGEHGEIHKHKHNFVKRHNVVGRIVPVVQIEPAKMQERHDELAEEMLRRGMNHQSPYEQPDVSYLPEWIQEAKVDTSISKSDLVSRCTICKIKIGDL
jgi:hypothetical protein